MFIYSIGTIVEAATVVFLALLFGSIFISNWLDERKRKKASDRIDV
jgi:hypothetical protein